MDSTHISVALAQYESTSQMHTDIARNALRKALQQQANLIVFPELWTTGYEPFPDTESEQELWRQHATWEGEPVFEAYRSLAKEHRIAIVLPYLESNAQRTQFYNAAAIIDANGDVVLNYRKVHTVDKAWECMLEAGDAFPVASLVLGQATVSVGVMICYDREFPESARLLMVRGAELVFTPNACVLDRNRLAQFQARGYENMMGVAMANYPRFGGKSVAYDGMRKKGENYDPTIVLADDKEGIVMAQFDIDALREYREREIWGDAYRRPGVYADLTQNDPQPPFLRENARR